MCINSVKKICSALLAFGITLVLAQNNSLLMAQGRVQPTNSTKKTLPKAPDVVTRDGNCPGDKVEEYSCPAASPDGTSLAEESSLKCEIDNPETFDYKIQISCVCKNIPARKPSGYCDTILPGSDGESLGCTYQFENTKHIWNTSYSDFNKCKEELELNKSEFIAVAKAQCVAACVLKNTPPKSATNTSKVKCCKVPLVTTRPELPPSLR